jgi:UDP-N-acetylglucosamine:LPS N-acetylglucosamine transferase
MVRANTVSTKHLKILMVASHGGHWVQLCRLNPLFEGQNLYYLSTNAGLGQELGAGQLYTVADANLDNKSGLFRLALQVASVMIRVRPQYVISTGAAPGFFALLFGKLMGARTIWLDSIANADRMSVSGQWVRPFADLWLTQWEHLADRKGPTYFGSVV